MTEWRAVPGCICHWVSDDGRVKTIVVHSRLLPEPVLMEPKTYGAGYYEVSIHCAAWPIHRLVMEVFVGPRPGKLCVNHIDGNKTNNRVENLEYVTQAENIRHAWRTGLIPGKVVNWDDPLPPKKKRGRRGEYLAYARRKYGDSLEEREARLVSDGGELPEFE